MRTLIVATLFLASSSVSAQAEEELEEPMPAAAPAPAPAPPEEEPAPSRAGSGPQEGTSTGQATTGSATGSTGSTGSTTGSTGSATTGSATTGSATTGSATTGSATTGSTGTERVLDEDQDPQSRSDEEEDEENWGVFWIEAQFGYSFVNLVQFSADNFIPEAEEIKGSGFFGGAALGFRIYFLTLGARATIASYFGFEVGTVGADVAVHLPIPVVSPYIRLGLGYAWMGDADWESPELSQTDVDGLVIDGGLGINIKLGRVISLGAGFDVAFLNLGRQSIRDAGNVGMVNLEESGDAVGLQIRVHGHLTFHI